MTDRLDRTTRVALLTDMLRVRRMEEKSAELYGTGKIRGFLHLYIGEEAVAAGAIRALSPDDNIAATYREHGHALLRGVPMKTIMAEMFGKKSGCCRGRGGSMHLFDRSRRFFGGNAIVAGGLPLCVGLALADKLQGTPRASVCFFGEGAMAEGAFHESINLAALWGLPVLFLCENNYYAMGTALARSESQTDLCAKAQSYRVPATSVDGMDVEAVHAATLRAADAVRSGSGPGFLEFRTYRFRPHSMFDPELYRDKAEIEKWRERDPISALASRMKADQMLDDGELQAIERKIADEVDSAVDHADASEWDSVESLAQDVCAAGARREDELSGSPA